MLSYDKYKESWERRVSTIAAHIDIDNKILTKNGLYKYYKKAVVNYDFTNKIIIDFGCGGGWLGKYIFDNFVPKKYIGLDIAERSIDAAIKNLEYIPNELKHIQIIDFNKINNLENCNADILICLSVIHHIPDKYYYDKFFNLLNYSKIKTIILQIKYFNELKFKENPYRTTNDIGNACYTNKNNILLDRYNLKNESGIDSLLYQYLYYEVGS